jgi:hypothetical protein
MTIPRLIASLSPDRKLFCHVLIPQSCGEQIWAILEANVDASLLEFQAISEQMNEIVAKAFEGTQYEGWECIGVIEDEGLQDVTVSLEVGAAQMEVPPLIPQMKPMDAELISPLPEPLKKPTAYWEFK